MKTSLNLIFSSIFLSAMLTACGGGGGGTDTGSQITNTITAPPTTTTTTATTATTPVNPTVTVVAPVPMREGAYVTRSLIPKATVGEQFDGAITARPLDERNEILGYTITNLTIGGATPSIKSSGSVTWLPNSNDLRGDGQLRINIRLKTGLETTHTVAFSVIEKKLVYGTSVGINDGTYSDPDGRFIVRVTRKNSTQPITSSGLNIWEFSDKNGPSYSRIELLGGATSANIEVFKKPIYASPKPSSSVNQKNTNGVSQQATTNAACSTAENVSHPLFPASCFDQNLESQQGSVLGKSWSVATRTNLWTSRPKFTYTYNIAGDAVPDESQPSTVFETLISHSSADSVSRATTKSPVILVHGFSGWDGATGGIGGGGKGTWGSLAKTLIAAGHPVFEFRWITSMRFEEAAGGLASFSKKVAEYTNSKPVVIAHSFGGIVAHLALSDQGIVFSADQIWTPVTGVNQIIAKLITLNSPLSGINYTSDGSRIFKSSVTNPVTNSAFPLTLGRDNNDTATLFGYENTNLTTRYVTIADCFAVTCLQAGADFSQDLNEYESLRFHSAIADGNTVALTQRGAKLFVTTPGSATLLWQGESINRLQSGLSKITVPVLKVTGYNSIALPEFNRAVVNANTSLGDGLISLIGQAARPSDFAIAPYDENSNFGYNFIDGIARKSVRGVTQTFNQLEVGDCHAHLNQYWICAGAAHTKDKRYSGDDYSVADYEDTIVGGKTHPLKLLIDSTSWLKAAPVTYGQPLSASAPDATLTWRAYTVANGVTSYVNPDTLRAEIRVMKQDGSLVTTFSSESFGTNSVDRYAINLGKKLANYLQAPPLLTSFKIKMSMGGTGGYAGTSKELSSIQANNDLGDFNLSTDSVVNVTGKVINGRTVADPVSNATIYLAKGVDLTAGYLKLASETNTKTARKLVSDASGNFVVNSIEPGEYSILVTKAGYQDQLQGKIYLAANTPVVLSVVNILVSGQASITLRWATAAGGTYVSPDLDSHLMRFSSTGALDYHINYFNLRPSGSVDLLDRDDMSYEGPETITLNYDISKNYIYYVHNYDSTGTTIPGSSPRVTLLLGGVESTYELPVSATTSGRYWRVFDIIQGDVVRCVINCLQNAATTNFLAKPGFEDLTMLPAEAPLLHKFPVKSQ